MARSTDPRVLEALVENSQDQLVYLDRDFNFVWVNRAYAETCHRRAEELLGHNHFDLFPHPENQAIFEKVRDTGVPAAWREKPFVFPNQPGRGTTYWDWTLAPVNDEHGCVEGFVFSLRDVTDGVVAREGLRRNEERLRLAQTSAGLGIWDWDRRTGQVTFCAELNRIYGVEDGTIRTYEDWRRLVYSEDLPAVERERDRAIQEGRPFDLQFRILHASGEVRWLGALGGAVRDEAGEIVRVLGVNIDITERQRLSNALRESEARYRSLFESMSEGHSLHEMVFDEAGRAVDYRFLEVNPAFGRLTGLDPSKVVGRTVREVLPDLEGSWIESYARVVSTGESERFQSYSESLGRWYEVFAYRASPGRFAVSFTDITERRKYEEELARAHERAASLARFPEENPDPVLRIGLGLTLVYTNTAARVALAGLDGLEVGRPVPAKIAEPVRRVMAGAGLARTEIACSDRVFSMAFCASGAEVNVYGHEITDRKRAEGALQKSERMANVHATELRAVLDAVPAAVWIARDTRGDRIEANRFGAELLRRPPGSNVSVSADTQERPTNFRVMRHGREIPADELPIQAAARAGTESRNTEFDVMFDDGNVRHLLGNAVPLRGERGEPVGSVGAFIDITERKEAELRLREAGRRKDEFLGMLSHELRNPLAPIGNSVFILDRVEPASEQAARAKAVIRRQLEHLTRLVDDLLDVTRIARGKIELRTGPLDFTTLVARTVDDHRSMFVSRGLTLRIEIPPDQITVDGDPTRLAQVVGNLLQNAAKFTPAAGTVAVRLRPLPHGLELEVRDDGVGIEPDLLPQIFEPFVQGERSLARTEGGLGLGLALVKGITELHGGAVRAESAGKGSGSAFIVRLPTVESETRIDPPQPVLERSRCSRRVLVVDDNRDAARSLAEIVKLLGHEVEVAFDGPEAIDRARVQRPEIVLCDIGLPGMTGYQVAGVLRSEFGTSIKLYAVSGYAQPEDRSRAVASGFDGHVAKPPDQADVARLLQAPTLIVV